MNSRSMLTTVTVLCLRWQSARSRTHRPRRTSTTRSANPTRRPSLPRDHGHARQGHSQGPVGESRVRRGLPVGDQGWIHRRRARWAWRRQLPHGRRGWSAPAYFNLGGASIGLQIGAQSTDFVMLFMNKEGLNSLLSDEFTLGGDASVAAGPGRPAGRSGNRPEAQRADPLLLAQQGFVCRARAQRRGHQAGQGRHARRLRRGRHGQRGPERQQGHCARRGAGLPDRARTLLVPQRHRVTAPTDRRGRDVAPVDASSIDALFVKSPFQQGESPWSPYCSSYLC